MVMKKQIAPLLLAVLCVLLSVLPAAAANGSPFKIQKTWSCSDGFFCSSETLGICSPPPPPPACNNDGISDEDCAP
jgi:hypothetical protein